MQIYAYDCFLSVQVAGVIDFDQRCGESSETMVSYGICEEVCSAWNLELTEPHQVVFILEQLP
jgi:hypothetical protein